jgi:hypothetical protein
VTAALPYYAMRDQPGCPWDAPRDWFVSDVTWMAWRCRRPLRVAEGRGQARTRLMATRTQRERTYRRDGFRCLFCGATSRLTVDHVVPVIFGGNNAPNNLRTLCECCNGSHFTAHHAPLLACAALAPEMVA